MELDLWTVWWGRMIHVLIGCALKREVATLQGCLRGDHEYLATGLGERRTRASLAKYFKHRLPSVFVFTGTAGQLDPSLRMGQVVCPEAWCRKDGATFAANPEFIRRLRQRGWEVARRGLTLSWPVLRAKSRRELYRRYGARVCDMESAAALEVASALGIPCLAVKVVSDTADSGPWSFFRHFHANMEKQAEYLSQLLPCLEPSQKKE